MTTAPSAGAGLPRVLSETTRTLADAAALLPGRNGGSPSKLTVWRWATAGVKSPAGGRIHLEAVKVGATYFTSVEAVSRFLAALPSTANVEVA